MFKRISAVFLLSLCCGAIKGAAEDCPVAQYRFVKEIGQIQITTGYMNRLSDLSSRLLRLERNGIVLLETDNGRTFTRKEMIGTHRIETTISIAPPVGHGAGGASSFVDLRVILDGKTRVDCPLSYGSFGLDRISIEPERGFVTLNGYDGILRFDGFESKNIVDRDWLDKRAEFTKQLIVRAK